MSGAHSPLPWTTGRDFANCGGGMNIVDARERRCGHTAEFAMGHPHPIVVAEAEANAEFIVRAVNAHDEMLAALRVTGDNLVTLCADIAAIANVPERYRAWLAVIDAAIAKGEGQ